MMVTAMSISAVFLGVVPLLLGVGIGYLAMQAVLVVLEVAVSRTRAADQALASSEAAAQGTGAVVIPFDRERRERTTGELKDRIAA